MTFTPELEEINSKSPCPSCGEKRLLPTAAATDGFYAKRRMLFSEKEQVKALKASGDTLQEVKHYHCLNCGYRFSENEDQKKFREKNAEDEKVDLPWPMGIIFLILMLGTILIMRIAEPNGGSSGGDGPNVSPSAEPIENIQPDIEPEEDGDESGEDPFLIGG